MSVVKLTHISQGNFKLGLGLNGIHDIGTNSCELISLEYVGFIQIYGF